MSNKKLNFEKSINASIVWCNAWERGEISDEVIAEHVNALINSQDGARAFFAVSLSSDCPLMDRLPEAFVIQLRSHGEIVVDLIIKNLAMSSAMALHHERHSNKKQKAGSERIKSRCIDLLRLLEPNSVKNNLGILQNSITGDGAYKAFLDKWNYDQEQREAIQESIYQIAKKN